MSLTITFTRRGQKDYEFWQTADKRIFNHLKELLHEMKETPFNGYGNPEALKHELAGKWSRHLTKKDRVVYELVDDTIIIYQCRFHY